VLTATCAREAEKREALLGWDQTPFLGIVEPRRKSRPS